MLAGAPASLRREDVSLDDKQNPEGTRKSGRLSMALGDVSLLDCIHVGVEHLLHFMLADGADSLLNDATALE